LPAECKLFILIPSCGCSAVPIVPTPSKRKEAFQHSYQPLVSIDRTRMYTKVSFTMSS
jgi:hypothetical protein